MLDSVSLPLTTAWIFTPYLWICSCPTVRLSQRNIEEASLPLSPIIPHNISVTTHHSYLSCPSSLFPLLCFWLLPPFSLFNCLFFGALLSLRSPLSVVPSLFLSLFSSLPSLLWSCLCPPFIHLCNNECCSLYPHPYDEPDGYAGRWMVRVKGRSEKRVCLCRSHFPRDTSVHRPWPEGTRH